MPRFAGPFSVPDPDADAWDEMVRQNRLLQRDGTDGSTDPGSSVADNSGSFLNDPRTSIDDWMRVRNGAGGPEDFVSDGTGQDSLAGGDGSDRVSAPPGPSVLEARYGLRNPSLSTSNTARYWRGHPGLAESLVPVLGSAREAIADAYDGNYAGAALNGLMAVGDVLVPEETIGKVLSEAGAKAAMRDGASMTWKNVRARMGRAGHFAPGEQGHHWSIPNRWTWVPESIRNHPLNIRELPADIHKRLHGNDYVKNLPKFNFLEGLQVGTPEWAQANAAWTAESAGSKAASAATYPQPPDANAGSRRP